MASPTTLPALPPSNTDKLTQIQDGLDQLLVRMFASLRYIDTHHPYAAIPGQPDMSPSQPHPQPRTHPTQVATQNTSDPSQPPTSDPAAPGEETRDSPDKFKAILQELAQDLVLKEQQIEFLIDTLPGLGNSQIQQENRIKDLEKELREVTEERKTWVGIQEELLGRVEGVIKGVRRV